MDKELLYLGLMHFPYGYGDAAKGYRDASERLKLPIRFIDISTVEGWNELVKTDLSNKSVIFHKRPLDEYSMDQRKCLSSVGRKIFMTVWECDRAPLQWNSELHDCDVIITPSSYSSASIQKTFPDKKYFELPHYIRNVHDKLGVLSDITYDNKINILYTNSQLTSRKGIDLALSAYYCLPREIHKVTRLIIKGVKGTARFCKSFMVEHNKPEIIVLEDFLTDQEMDDLFNSCHIFFSPNRGEGFGIDIVRSWLMGLTNVITDIGGYSTILTKKELSSAKVFAIKSTWDYAYCKATYHDTDVHRLMWPAPSLKDVVNTLETAILTVQKGMEKKGSITEINDRIDRYNKSVDEIFTHLMLSLSTESESYTPAKQATSMSIPFILATGGLGDMMNSVFSTTIWEYLSTINKKHILLLFTHNQSSKEVFANHPNKHMFDIELISWLDNTTIQDIVTNAGYNIGLIMNSYIKIKPNPTFRLPMTSVEETQLSNLLSPRIKSDRKHKIVVIQPFSGDVVRDIPTNILTDIVNTLHDKYQMNTEDILIIGKNYTRLAAGKNNIHATECVDPSVQHLCTNLIDKLSVATTTNLIAECDTFIGTHSYGAMVAWNANKPNLVLYDEETRKRHFEKPDNWSFGMIKPNTTHGLFSQYKSKMLENIV